MTENTLIRDMIAASPDRRKFVRSIGLAGAMAAAAATGKTAYAQAAITDLDILQFALNLEYLEAEFYTAATTGQAIAQFGSNITGSGTAGATTGGSQVTFSDAAISNIAKELASNEQVHVKLLRDTITGLGGTPIAKPAINLAALGIGFGSQADFLVVARALEDIGVTAYGGAAPLIQDKTILGAAARILAVEAMHAGAIRVQIARLNLPTTALDALDHIPPPSGTLYFNTDSNALSEVRTPGEVLKLAYGGAANATSGGFFPTGVNGNLRAASGTAPTPTGNSITASPNPVPVQGGNLGQTTISWNAPNASVVEIRLGGPTGQLFAMQGKSGSMMTGRWIQDGLTFFLVDVSDGKTASAANVLSSVVIRLQRS
ncbi:MAG: ferritin-like domain-containing protein [Bryobacteraceae bacterium]|nr:ferritin-like domain-containing protein [Bryobacteraceae bacterium]